MSKQEKAIHLSHPNGSAHPFKAATLCGVMVRFGGMAVRGEREATCKKCLKINEKICPTCGGTGLKGEK